MNIKIYVKPKKVIGIVVKEDDNIIGGIHSRWNSRLNAYEVRRVFSKRNDLAKRMYLKLFSLMKNCKFTNDNEACLPKAFEIWKTLTKEEHLIVSSITNDEIVLADCSCIHYMLGKEEYLSFLDKDWFKSITEFRVLYSSYLRKIMPLGGPSLYC